VNNNVRAQQGLSSIAMVVIVVVIVLVGGIIFYLTKNNTDQSIPASSQEIGGAEMPIATISNMPMMKQGSSVVPTQSAVATKEPALTADNFTQSGNLINASGSTGAWLLMYEEPSNPAAQAVLLFDQSSKCDLGSGLGPCDEDKFTVGDRVTVSGKEKAGVVTVNTLTK